MVVRWWKVFRARSLIDKVDKIGKVGFADTIGTISLKAADRTFDKIVEKIVKHGTSLLRVACCLLLS